jgi:hypothetical protein
MQQIAAYLDFAQLIRRAPIARGKAADTLHVDPSWSRPKKPAVVMSAIILSRNSLIGVILRSDTRDICPGLKEIPSIASSREACSNYGEADHEQPAGARIAYCYYPRSANRLERGGIEFVVVLQPSGSFACLPAWMIEAAASRFELVDEPHFPLQILCSMRTEVDAFLNFLRSESKTEKADNGVQIRKSPTKSVRREDAARGAVPGSDGRARRPPRSTTPRDRGRWST